MTSKGFSLIEVLLAAAVLGILTIAILPFFKSINQVNQVTADDQGATLIAKSFLEELRDAWSSPSFFDAETLRDGTAVQGHRLTNSVTGLACQVSVSDPDGGSYSQTIRKLVQLSCLAADKSTSTFLLELGRPL